MCFLNSENKIKNLFIVRFSSLYLTFFMCNNMLVDNINFFHVISVNLIHNKFK